MTKNDLVKSLKLYVKDDDVKLGRISFLVHVMDRIREDLNNYYENIDLEAILDNEDETHSKS